MRNLTDGLDSYMKSCLALSVGALADGFQTFSQLIVQYDPGIFEPYDELDSLYSFIPLILSLLDPLTRREAADFFKVMRYNGQ